MKKTLMTLLALVFAFSFMKNQAQDQAISPSMISTAIYHDVVGPLKDFPAMTPEELAEMDAREIKMVRNKDLQYRNYPYWEETRPTTPDKGLQDFNGNQKSLAGIIQNWEGQYTYSTPPDCNGTAGPDHYMQTVNVKYTIYDKQGNVQAGPTNLNTLFSGVPGSNANDGDPVVLFDEQAQKFLVAEFSGVSTNPDYMLIAVSQTDDPTGLWDRWSFVMNGFPDYMKFGIWRDGYYMGTNTGNGDDIYVFERDEMIAGGSSPQMVQFNNPYRPNSGFHCVLPIDNDGAFAPVGTPGGFITINDNAWGGSDQLWIYQLDVDWTNPSAATFNRTQQINVEPFDSYFGPTWDNIYQPGTGQRLDAINQILMHRAQYRNFSGSQHIVCNHTIDVDNTDHAGIRWYELEHNGTEWAIRQFGTYAPDQHSRWMGSIAMNADHEIALGYSVSSTTVYPSIRYAGQSAPENANATGVLDVAEVSIHEGSVSQPSYNRWGDYSNLAVDPVDQHTFWFTTQYMINSSMKGTKIASFEFASAPDVDFEADNLTPSTGDVVAFTDLTTGNPIFWSWSFTPNTVTFKNGTTASSVNPEVSFDAPGFYTVSLTATNTVGPATETKVDYIEAMDPTAAPVADFEASNTTPQAGEIVVFTDLSSNSPTSWEWEFTPANVTYENGTDATSQNPEVSFDAPGLYTVQLTATNLVGSGIETKTDYVDVLEAMTVVATADPEEMCYGEASQLDALPSGGSGSYTYNWTSDPAGFSSTQQNPVVSPMQTTTYTVEVNDGNQTVSGTVTVTVNPLPEITLGDWPEMLCNQNVSPVLLTAAPEGGVFSGASVTASGWFDPENAPLGYNVITYTYQDENGCENIALDSIYVDDCVGIIEFSTDEVIVNLYPNPTAGAFTLESEKEIDRIEIIDQSGKVVMMRKVVGKSVNLSALRAKGLYFVRIYIENENALPTLVTKEFIIN
ncbi:MAG TPA: PKD domain-containing protein [Bacteroidales bacterium]|nr:PKD domain-containing protein [Bacteroidales bacterium]